MVRAAGRDTGRLTEDMGEAAWDGENACAGSMRKEKRNRMNVYFDENFWGCERERTDQTPGKKIPVEKEFVWDGRTWRIPAVYVCEEGLVVDFCIRIPAEEIEAFWKKWRPRIGKLSDEEQLCAEQENPLSLDVRTEVWIDGDRAEGWSGCGTSFIPPYLKDESEAHSASFIEEQMMEAYECDCRDGWKFERLSVSWPEGVQVPVHSLVFQLKKNPVSYPGPRFRTEPEEEKKQVKFIHPATGTEHILTVQSLEQIVLPEQDFSEIKSMRMRVRKTPTHLLTMFYTVEPGLPLYELQIFDCAESDPPVLEKETGAAGVSVIGGADGPTAIFFAGKTATGHKGWSSASSSLHYKPVSAVEWRMEFRVESSEKTEVKITL